MKLELADRVLVKAEKLNLNHQAESSFQILLRKTQTAVVLLSAMTRKNQVKAGERVM